MVTNFKGEPSRSTRQDPKESGLVVAALRSGTEVEGEVGEVDRAAAVAAGAGKRRVELLPIRFFH